MVRFMSFSSGSCGNCYYLGTQDRGILIDAGVSVRRLRKALDAAGLMEDSFGAVLVTHDHQDHIRHLDKFCQYLHKPVYATDELHRALAFRRSTQDTIAGYRQVLGRGRWNDIDGTESPYFLSASSGNTFTNYRKSTEEDANPVIQILHLKH